MINKMSETQIVAALERILPELNNETKCYEDKWPYAPYKKPRSLQLCCGLCNNDRIIANRQLYDSHKKGKGHLAHFERWKTDEKEKQDLRDKNKKLEKEKLRMIKKNKKLVLQSSRKDREIAELKERLAVLVVQLDNTQSESDDEFEDAEEAE